MNSNKQYYYKKLSLINHFSKFKQLPGSHDILYTKSLEETKKVSDRKSNGNMLEIEYKIPGTSTRAFKSIPYIENLDDVDIISWVEKFKHYSITLKWNESVRMAYLMELLEVDLEDIPTANKSSFEILDDFLHRKYKTQDIAVLQSSIRLICQDDYYLIDEYNLVIINLAKECKLLKNWDNERYKEYLEELFMNNLSRDVKILLTDQQIFTYDQALPYLRRKENLIIAEYKKGTITKHIKNNNAHQNPTYNKFTNNTGMNKTSTFKNNNSTYKPFQNNFKLKDSNSNNESGKSNNKSYAFVENNNRIKPFEASIIINNVATKALIDTGAGETYVSQALVNKLDLPTLSTRPLTFETADGRAITVNKKVYLDFNFSNLDAIKYKITPYVLENTGIDVILGSTFLLTNEVLIDYKNKTMVIDNLYIDMILENDYEDCFDNELALKTKLYVVRNNTTESYFHLNSCIPETTKKFLKEAVLNNHTLGTIPNYQYQIEVNGSHTHAAKPYKVPILLKDN